MYCRIKAMWVLVGLVAVVVMLAGCSKEAGRQQEYKIAAILPISGPNAAQGIGMMNSCKAAIDELKRTGKLKDIQLKLMELDDESKPEAAVRAAERAAQDPKVVAVTAHWNSGCALATNPVFHSHGLANLVPAAINSKITLEQEGDEIFRIDPHDLIIVEYAARFAVTREDWKRVYVIDDNTFYGKELARKFRGFYEQDGRTVIGQDAVNVGEQDFTALLTRIDGSSPDVIFFGGVVAEAALIRRQMKTVGMEADFISLTGIFTESFIKAAGPAAEGAFSVTVVPPIDLLPGSDEFLAAYERGKYSHPHEAWGVYAYASIQVLAEAISRSLPNPDRRTVIDQLKTGEFETVLGDMRFDSDGQTTLVTLFIYEVTDGQWVPRYYVAGSGELAPFES
ncbi:MAG: branched-chain amino acid ABC transporter substrate-binding protein [bacterium]